MANIKYKNDYNLVHRYLCGDEEAGRILYADVYIFIRSSIYKLTKTSIFSDEDREDILQDTLMTSIEKLDIYNGTSKFSTFLYGIARNKIKERLRSKKLDLDIEEYYDDLGVVNKDPLSIIIEKEKKLAIVKAMDSLSENHKQVIRFKFNGMSTKDIALLSNKSEEAIDSMYRRALKSLKKIFEKLQK